MAKYKIGDLLYPSEKSRWFKKGVSYYVKDIVWNKNGGYYQYVCERRGGKEKWDNKITKAPVEAIDNNGCYYSQAEIIKKIIK